MTKKIENVEFGGFSLASFEGDDSPYAKAVRLHICHAKNCYTPVSPEKLMCLSHWKKVPKTMQEAVYANYRKGQCTTGMPSKEWLKAARDAINSVS